MLDATYTPHDYCLLDIGDSDVGGSGPVLLPDLTDLPTTTSSLVTFGGKQGIAYLLDTSALPGNLTARPTCDAAWDGASRDTSLLPPVADGTYCDFAPHATCVPPAASSVCVPGPLLAFGPAGDLSFVDHAKMRTTPAFFRADDGMAYLYVSGSTKAALCSIDDVPPSVVRLSIRTAVSGAAYLTLDEADTETRFFNPGSPVVSSLNGSQPVVWVIDENDLRSAYIVTQAAPHPILYALDGLTMQVLYRSGAEDLNLGGKYTTPVIAHGMVFIATDRIQAFGVH